MPYARKRSSAGGATRAQVAAAIGARTAARFPYSKYGSAHYLRGSPGSVSKFGPSYRAASPYQQAVRKATGFVGRGKYSLPRFVNDLKLVEPIANRFLTKGIPRMISAASGVRNLMGRGMYSASENAVYTGRGIYNSNNLIDGGRPSMQFDGSKDETQTLMLSHCEYIGDVYGPANSQFNVTSYNINPGLSSNFPFLAQFAQNFDEYELVQMIFEFHSTIDSASTNNPSGNSGTIMMSTNYKADASLFQSKDEMIQYHGGISGRLTESLHHGVECHPDKNAFGVKKFIRTGDIYDSDLKLFDIGIFQLAFQNTPSSFQNVQVGELWVTYRVKLMKPKLTQALGNSMTMSKYLSGGSESVTSYFGGASNANILSAVGNNIAMSITQADRAIVLTFPAALSGVFEIRLSIMANADVTLGGSFAPLISSGVSPVADIYGRDNASSSDSPTWFLHQFDTSGCVMILHVKVQPVGSILVNSAVVNNTVTLFPMGSTATGGTIMQTSLEVLEIGSQFRTSNLVAAPRWLNSSGALVTTNV